MLIRTEFKYKDGRSITTSFVVGDADEYYARADNGFYILAVDYNPQKRMITIYQEEK